MDKLSIYELLSFIIPGFLAAKIIEYYLNFYDLTLPFPIDGKLDDNLLLLVVAIIFGVAIHVLTFKIIGIESFKWLKAWIYKPEIEYIKDSKFGELPMIMPAVKKYYEQDKNHKDELSKIKVSETAEIEYYAWTFDFAYYYLEVNDKITQAKNFQSFYFLFRNLFVMSMVHFALIIIMGIASFFVDADYNILNMSSVRMVILLMLLTWLIVVVTGWLRGKMIDRILWSYYVDRSTKGIDNNNK